MKKIIAIITFCMLLIGNLGAVETVAAADEKIDKKIIVEKDNSGIFKQMSKMRDESYKLHKYDVLKIDVVGFIEQGWMQGIGIGPDGKINLPYMSQIKLAGLTVAEAEKIIEEKAKEYYKIPEMSVSVSSYGPRQIYVVGEVRSNGMYSLPIDNMNIFAAISSAGGITNRGRPKHIAVIRVVDGETYMTEVNLDAFVKKQDSAQNIQLEDGDMIYVPQSNKIIIQEDVMPFINYYLLFDNITRR